MRGIARGEASTGVAPFIQLYTRLGEFLKDPVSGTFKIEDVSDPNGSPITRVATTSLNLNLVSLGGHKLSKGRFYLPTGSTTTWRLGTHRAVVSYVMVASGRTYTQVIEFEVLNPLSYVSGQSYVGYASTKDLYLEGYFDSGGTPPNKLHPVIQQISYQLETLTERFFEPRYLEMHVDGSEAPVLFLDEAIVALDTLYAIERLSDGSEDLTAYDANSFVVSNRHLDGLLNPDDRYNPRISLPEVRRLASGTVIGTGFTFPYGKQSLKVAGVFGYTDPEPMSDRVLIGITPKDFVQIIGVLATRYCEDPTFSSMATHRPGMVKSVRTRDQSISFYNASGSVSFEGGLTGDAMIDKMLQRFIKPARLGYADRDKYFVYGNVVD